MPTIGVLKVQAPMIGENRKLTLKVPNFCSRNKMKRTTAEITSTKADIHKSATCKAK